MSNRGVSDVDACGSFICECLFGICVRALCECACECCCQFIAAACSQMCATVPVGDIFCPCCADGAEGALQSSIMLGFCCALLFIFGLVVAIAAFPGVLTWFGIFFGP